MASKQPNRLGQGSDTHPPVVSLHPHSNGFHSPLSLSRPAIEPLMGMHLVMIAVQMFLDGIKVHLEK